MAAPAVEDQTPVVGGLNSRLFSSSDDCGTGIATLDSENVIGLTLLMITAANPTPDKRPSDGVGIDLSNSLKASEAPWAFHCDGGLQAWAKITIRCVVDLWQLRATT